MQYYIVVCDWAWARSDEDVHDAVRELMKHKTLRAGDKIQIRLVDQKEVEPAPYLDEMGGLMIALDGKTYPSEMTWTKALDDAYWEISEAFTEAQRPADDLYYASLENPREHAENMFVHNLPS